MPRAAAFEKRIKLCIANPGNISWGNSIGAASSMPKALRPPMADGLVKNYAWKHGIENDIDIVIEEIKKYDNSDILDKLSKRIIGSKIICNEEETKCIPSEKT